MTSHVISDGAAEVRVFSGDESIYSALRGDLDYLFRACALM